MITLLSSGLDNFLEFLYVMIIFAAVLAVAYLITRWFGRLQKNQYSKGNLELLEACRLSGSKYVQIVRIGSRYYALAICRDTVTVIGELKEDELKPADKEEAVKISSFKEIFDRVRGNKQDEQKK